MANFRGWEWIIILALALLLFGGFKKMPDAARGIGRSLRIFKAETKGLTDEDGKDKPADEAGAPAVAIEAPTATPTASNSAQPATPPLAAAPPAATPPAAATPAETPSQDAPAQPKASA